MKMATAIQSPNRSKGFVWGIEIWFVNCLRLSLDCCADHDANRSNRCHEMLLAPAWLHSVSFRVLQKEILGKGAKYFRKSCWAFDFTNWGRLGSTTIELSRGTLKRGHRTPSDVFGVQPSGCPRPGPCVTNLPLDSMAAWPGSMAERLRTRKLNSPNVLRPLLFAPCYGSDSIVPSGLGLFSTEFHP